MHEIIHVVDPAEPSGTARHGLEIEAAERALAAGYYFVLWPTKPRLSRPRGKRYYGPFRTRVEARMLLTSAVALGLAENEYIRSTVAECRAAIRPRATAGDRPAAPAWTDMPACAAC